MLGESRTGAATGGTETGPALSAQRRHCDQHQRHEKTGDSEEWITNLCYFLHATTRQPAKMSPGRQEFRSADA